MEKKTKKYLYIGGAIALFLILIGWYFYAQGKKTVTIADLPVDDPNNPSGNTTSASDSEISAISSQLYNDMNGWNFASNHNISGYNSALALSDSDFVKLYNFYNTKYQKDSGQTLTEWVSSEYAIPYSPYDTVKDVLQKRLGKLNLK